MYVVDGKRIAILDRVARTSLPSGRVLSVEPEGSHADI